jgi:hypothetical protein
MTDWHIIRTETGREHRVAAALHEMGVMVWVPVEFVAYRTAASRRSRLLRKYRILPAIPRTLFAATETARLGEFHQIRYFDSVERDWALVPLKIPDNQVQLFRETLDRHNEQEARRAMTGTGTKAGKRKWQKLEPAKLPEIMREMFGGNHELPPE